MWVRAVVHVHHAARRDSRLFLTEHGLNSLTQLRSGSAQLSQVWNLLARQPCFPLLANSRDKPKIVLQQFLRHLKMCR